MSYFGEKKFIAEFNNVEGKFYHTRTLTTDSLHIIYKLKKL